MASWQVTGRLKVGFAALAGAVAVSMVAPTAAEAAAVNQDTSSPNDTTDHRQEARDVQAHQISDPGAGSGPATSAPQQSAPNQSSPSAGQGSSPSPTQRKDKPPDRDPHKFSPQTRSSADHASPGSGSGSSPTTKVGTDRPKDRDPN